ncbi:outer membrane assembly protein [Tannerella forsythia]|uniref:Outer membrane assembly protein n=1 Tax=Tannerella forsythia TaxID=28112 RepID=A0A3P1YNW7_TANFO|nr:outer membrane assembly protein [Tannerella forsythia]RRD72709.1 outer membrane assembly protein [Tannerella forsythia]
MKYIIGTIAVACILCTAAFFSLELWGIENPVTFEQLQKGLKTAMIIGVTSILLLIVIPFFFKNNGNGYDRTKGNVAKPKIGQGKQ